jgi:tetratricopeptide (TPR) repeat protein
MDGWPEQAQELRQQIEATLASAVDPHDALPLLHRLARMAREGSDESLFANSQLAELLVERHPWRAALCARRALAHHPDDDRGWATFALCQTLLGNYKVAVAAYRRAVAVAPSNPWYAHNLGHLLDVALGRTSEAELWLKRAYRRAADSAEVCASYAHALARMGRLADARKVLTRAGKRMTSREHGALLRWIDEGAPEAGDQAGPTSARIHPIALRSQTRPKIDPKPDRDTASEAVRTRKRRRNGALAEKQPPRAAIPVELEAVLARGLASLPLDSKQRARARGIARDAGAYFSRPLESSGTRGPRALREADAIAAAIAYAIVYVDHVPLTQSEVAACFRVSVASLRGRFGELRVRLELMPGDSRYRTLRRL